jgi:lipoprotein signal peptidase
MTTSNFSPVYYSNNEGATYKLISGITYQLELVELTVISLLERYPSKLDNSEILIRQHSHLVTLEDFQHSPILS